MTKGPKAGNPRQQKAEALDVFVKTELARTRAVSAAKIARLKALRLARDGEKKS